MQTDQILKRLDHLQFVLEIDTLSLEKYFNVWERMLINNERASLFETLNDLLNQTETSRNYQVKKEIEIKINSIIKTWKQ